LKIGIGLSPYFSVVKDIFAWHLFSTLISYAFGSQGELFEKGAGEES
jgi:hypothetical protein